MLWNQVMTKVKSMNAEEARKFIADNPEGTYTILDVRQPWEYGKGHLPGGKLIPLGELMDSLKKMQKDKPIIVHCASGMRSRMAAQLMTGMGFKEVYNLEGGINAWHGRKLSGAFNEGVRYLKGNEKPKEIIVLAYGMEIGLGSFYAAMADKTEDKETASLFSRLSKVEESHKNLVFKMYKQMDMSVVDQNDFEKTIVPEVMEGGLTSEQFIDKYQPHMSTLQDVLELAMTIEVQAMDLYIRYSGRVEDEESKKILFALAEAEKTHLKSLGSGMDRLGN